MLKHRRTRLVGGPRTSMMNKPWLTVLILLFSHAGFWLAGWAWRSKEEGEKARVELEQEHANTVRAEQRVAFVLDSARMAHKAELERIANLPELRFDDYYEPSADAAAAMAKLARMARDRPRRFIDSTTVTP